MLSKAIHGSSSLEGSTFPSPKGGRELALSLSGSASGSYHPPSGFLYVLPRKFREKKNCFTFSLITKKSMILWFEKYFANVMSPSRTQTGALPCGKCVDIEILFCRNSEENLHSNHVCFYRDDPDDYSWPWLLVTSCNLLISLMQFNSSHSYTHTWCICE